MKPLSLINTQLKITYFYPLLKTTNNILVGFKLKDQIEIETYKEKLAGLMYKTNKILLPTIKYSTPKLPLMTSTGMNSSMDQ